jgi:hypothetical protein
MLLARAAIHSFTSIRLDNNLLRKELIMDNGTSTQEDWKHNPWIVGGLVVLFFPYGLYLLWKHPTWTSRAKWTSTVAYFACLVVGAIKDEDRNVRSGDDGSGQASTVAGDSVTDLGSKSPSSTVVTSGKGMKLAVKNVRQASHIASASGEYLPYIPGTNREYIHAIHLPDGRGTAVSLNSVSFKDDGVIESTMTKVGRLIDQERELSVSNTEWIKDIQQREITTTYQRTRNGFVETSLSDKSVWYPDMKVGAKPDDTWEWIMSPDEKNTYLVTDLATWNGMPALTVNVECLIPNPGNSVVLHTRTYAMGVGLVKSSGIMVKRGGITVNRKMYDRKLVVPD